MVPSARAGWVEPLTWTWVEPLTWATSWALELEILPRWFSNYFTNMLSTINEIGDGKQRRKSRQWSELCIIFWVETTHSNMYRSLPLIIFSYSDYEHKVSRVSNRIVWNNCVSPVGEFRIAAAAYRWRFLFLHKSISGGCWFYVTVKGSSGQHMRL